MGQVRSLCVLLCGLGWLGSRAGPRCPCCQNRIPTPRCLRPQLSFIPLPIDFSSVIIHLPIRLISTAVIATFSHRIFGVLTWIESFCCGCSSYAVAIFLGNSPSSIWPWYIQFPFIHPFFLGPTCVRCRIAHQPFLVKLFSFSNTIRLRLWGTGVTAPCTESAGEGGDLLWPHPFKLSISVTLLPFSLKMNTDVENTGDEEMAFTCLLRAYFRVNDIKKASVMGFKGSEYVTANEIAPGTFTDGREKATIERERERRIASI